MIGRDTASSVVSVDDGGEHSGRSTSTAFGRRRAPSQVGHRDSARGTCRKKIFTTITRKFGMYVVVVVVYGSSHTWNGCPSMRHESTNTYYGFSLTLTSLLYVLHSWSCHKTIAVSACCTWAFPQGVPYTSFLQTVLNVHICYPKYVTIKSTIWGLRRDCFTHPHQAPVKQCEYQSHCSAAQGGMELKPSPSLNLVCEG